MFKRLLAKRALSKTSLYQTMEAEIAKIDFSDPAARIGWRMSQIIGDQLTTLNLERESVPPTGIYKSPTFRGAVLGTAFGIAKIEGVDNHKELLLDTILGAFIIVYGDDIGRFISFATVDEYRNGDEAVVEASNWAEEDLVLVLTAANGASIAGIVAAGMGML